MGTLEAIIGGIITLALLLFGAHRVGKSQGRTEAQADAKEQVAAATTVATKRRVEVIKEASDVQQTVNNMPDDDVDRELRDNWTRKG
ncbi:hypothetical protein B2M27_25370 [Kluyvera intermedia]|uniref:DUF2681 domain-containing protein n=1 Tax=Kluyvera intermedia TaxID=61648 RepID=A0ABX3U9A4_KLUIN|nr:hypothetical protein [Kluyvera intermedia]ORJ47580.1 hypothetical protein B2M27_25370 [Kluyvera intermedia]